MSCHISKKNTIISKTLWNDGINWIRTFIIQKVLQFQRKAFWNLNVLLKIEFSQKESHRSVLNIENPAKHLNWNVFQKQLTAGFSPLTIFQDTLDPTWLKLCVAAFFTVYSIQIKDFLSRILFETLINNNLEHSDLQIVEVVLENSIDISGNISLRNATIDFFLKPKGLIEEDFFEV